MIPTLTHWLLLVALLFCVGLFGLLTRRDGITRLISIELMANAISELGRPRPTSWRRNRTSDRIIGIGLAFASAMIGLAVLIRMHRQRPIEQDQTEGCTEWSSITWCSILPHLVAFTLLMFLPQLRRGPVGLVEHWGNPV